jgi:hypothetical protein
MRGIDVYSRTVLLEVYLLNFALKNDGKTPVILLFADNNVIRLASRHGRN